MFMVNQIQGFQHNHEALIHLESFESAFSGQNPSGWTRTRTENVGGSCVASRDTSVYSTEGSASCKIVFAHNGAGQQIRDHDKDFDLTRVRRIFADFRVDYWNSIGGSTPIFFIKVTALGTGTTSLGFHVSSDSAFVQVRYKPGRNPSLIGVNVFSEGSLDVSDVIGNTTMRITFDGRDCNGLMYLDNIRFIG